MSPRECLKKCKSDAEKWQWLINNKDADYMIMLDNNDTFVTFSGGEDYITFDSYLGHSDGVLSLLNSLGLRAEGV